MKLRTLFCLPALLLFLSVQAQNPKYLAEVRAFEQARYEAIRKADLPALDGMLAPELIYTHSNGTVEDKSAYLEALRNGFYQFTQFETDSTNYRFPTQKMAVATGIARIAGQINGKPFKITARFTALYVRRRGHWMLHTWQTTRLR